MSPAAVFAMAVVCAYNLALLAGFVWLVMHGWSPWWFVAVLIAMKSFDYSNNEDSDND